MPQDYLGDRDDGDDGAWSHPAAPEDLPSSCANHAIYGAFYDFLSKGGQLRSSPSPLPLSTGSNVTHALVLSN